MSGSTSPDSIYYATTGDNMDPAVISAAEATAVQAAFTSRFSTQASKTYKWANAAARTAQAGMTEGDTGYQLDTDKFYYYSGSAWVQQASDQPFVVLALSANQSLATGGAGAAVSWDVEIKDDYAMHSAGNPTRLVCTTAGTYEVAVNGYINATTGFSTLWGKLNGVDIRNSGTRKPGDTNAGTPELVMFSVPLAVNDYVEIFVICSVAGAVFAGGTAIFTSGVTMKRIGA